MNSKKVRMGWWMSIAWLSVIATTALLVSACGVVGWKYRYEGQEYTMTRENSEYHQLAIHDVRSRYGDPRAQRDVAKLKGACELLQKYATDSPEGGSFTPARDLLDAEARATCARWHHEEAEATARLEHQKRQDAMDREQARREQERTAAKEREERDRVSSMLQHTTRTVEACNASEQARVARKRHTEILARSPGPGAIVRKECTPRMETASVKSQCKDDNGFVRPCTKSVTTGDVAGYTCPKTMDQEVVQLGLYQLSLLDAYPFPEDRSIRVRDEECEDARARQEQLREKLNALTPNKPTSSASSASSASSSTQTVGAP